MYPPRDLAAEPTSVSWTRRGFAAACADALFQMWDRHVEATTEEDGPPWELDEMAKQARDAMLAHSGEVVAA